MKDGDVIRLQANINEALRTIENLPWMNGVLLENIVLTSGVDNTVNHGLGRSPNGFVVIDKQVTCDVWRSPTVNNLTDLSLLLRTSSTATVKLWVF